MTGEDSQDFEVVGGLFVGFWAQKMPRQSGSLSINGPPASKSYPSDSAKAGGDD